MNVNELRIGNFIEQPNGLNQVFSIDVYEGIINTYEQEDIKPVALNEKWIIGFGGTKMEDKNCNVYALCWNWNEEDQDFNDCTIITQDVDGKWYVSYNNKLIIEHVHQFQNWFYAISKEELTWKQ